MTLRWYQSESVQAAWDFLRSSPGNPVICLPTGAGKSLVIGELCREAVERWGGRVIVLAHRKELLQQNAAKIRAAAPGLDVGIYSAGLDRRDTEHSVVVAGIQSVFRRAEEFGQRHLVLVDECHLIQPDGFGMYRTFLDSLRSINPRLRMTGLTATPYRLDSGPLCRPDGLFQKICYSAPVRRLIADGYLCNLTTRPAATTVDTSGLKLRGGEFVASDAERLFSGVVDAACSELVRLAAGRRACLVFASGVTHADQVATHIERLTGERVGVVTGDTWPMLREQTLSDFRQGRLRWCVNVDVLTTGFDAPNIDCIGVLRATMSPGLFAQIVGRGFRVSPEKSDCLVLDFGGNIRRHGPIDSDDYGVTDKRQRTAGEAPVKSCPNCHTECLIGATECRECGFIFPRDREANHDHQADDSQILSEPETWLVESIRYAVHYKRKDPEATPTLRVDYDCRREGASGDLAGEVISEWVCLEHAGFARKKAERWWKARSVLDPPETISEACDLCRRGAVGAPRSIVAARQGRFWRVLSAALDERPEEWASEEAGVDPFAEVFEEAVF
jgi:DNA repair protein RadD